MSALRGSARLFSRARPLFSRNVSTKAAAGHVSRSLKPLILGTALVGYGVYKYMKSDQSLAEYLMPAVHAAGLPESQPSVYSQGKNHALYLWISLKPEANAKEVAKAVAKLQKYVDQVTDPSMKDEEDEILAGVGFGPNFYKQIGGKPKQEYTYPYRKGYLGEMPSSGGDVFIHAKCNTPSKLFELAQVVMKNMPPNSVESFEDIYSFVYKNGRDLSGFIDGTENAADEESRQKIAVEPETGGSYVITQKWIHDLKVIDKEKDKTLESWVGRSRPDSTELSRKSITSHVARMTGGNGWQQAKPVEIVRQSMPFGTLGSEAGLFFIGYAASPKNHEYMLDRMVGARDDTNCDDIMRLSKNVKGTYWYFPGADELKKFA
ncbi:dye-decolorizing peroxidase YfeX-like [Saccostrea echinata]|uniref:dye-decolorizing peroxidase YfeX-like n=1 Tax=Saccostrea echinata TaxID=191078 RepID=UPI002A82EB25|nr:dye-decolorizing peroxidase YfeX-like [Saccostrea echinata]